MSAFSTPMDALLTSIMKSHKRFQVSGVSKPLGLMDPATQIL